MITIDEIMKGQAVPNGLADNLNDLYHKINLIREKYGKPMVVTSGYRSIEYELSKGRSGKSDHCKCKAVDIYDPDKGLAKWCHDNQEFIESIPLWIEHTDYTKNWVHFTTTEKSKTFFIPY